MHLRHLFSIDDERATKIDQAVKAKTKAEEIETETSAERIFLAILLTMEGDVKAVESITQKFEIGHTIQIYAIGGHTDKVNELAKEDHYHFAAYGYAFGGHTSKVTSLIEHHKAARHFAIQGYAANGYIDQVNALIRDECCYNEALKGYERGIYFKKDKHAFLKLLALTENAMLKDKIAERANYLFVKQMHYQQALSLYELVYPDKKSQIDQYDENNFFNVLTLLGSKDSAQQYDIPFSVRRGPLFRAIQTLPQASQSIVFSSCLDDSTALGKRFRRKKRKETITNDSKFIKKIEFPSLASSISHFFTHLPVPFQLSTETRQRSANLNEQDEEQDSQIDLLL